MVVMNQLAIEHRVLGLLADLLDYPSNNPAEQARECAELLATGVPEAATHLRAFHEFVEGLDVGRLEELYTITFDLDATCHPYVGFQIFGESYQRSSFLVALQESYHAEGFVARESDLADHLGIILRFLSRSPDIEQREELISEAILPAVRKMSHDGDEEPRQTTGAIEANNDGFEKVLSALKDTVGDDDVLREEIYSEGLLPTLKKITPENDLPEVEQSTEPYGYDHVMRAVRLVLQDLSPTEN